ncbi:MAG: YoaH family protein [Aquificae bacterium]|nr:YoaH family protein [Aquificota bacterium]
MNIKEIKELAKKFTPEQLENCILQTINKGENECEISGDIMEVVNTLAKAQTVRELMEQGMSEMEAIRELAKRIRKVQGVEK